MRINDSLTAKSNGGGQDEILGGFYERCFMAIGGRSTATIILNDHGDIVLCSPACLAMFGREEREILGRHISTFLPRLASDIDTPGNNVAKASYRSMNGGWKQFTILDMDGESVCIELRLDVQTVDLRHLILIWVRQGSGRHIDGTLPSFAAATLARGTIPNQASPA